MQVNLCIVKSLVYDSKCNVLEGVCFDCVCRGLNRMGKSRLKKEKTKPVPFTTGIVVRHKTCVRASRCRAPSSAMQTTL